MFIIGCDFHTRYQQIAMCNEQTGEITERRLDHLNGEAERFYRSFTEPVRVGVEATGSLAWFERLLAELGQDEASEAVAKTYLLSETGKVYTLLAHAAGKLS
jgi:hypothetical protein